jgi:hypothetical protein
VVRTQWWRDHHRYSERDLRDVLVDFERCEAELILTTEKDAVKIEKLLLGPTHGWTGRRHTQQLKPIPANANLGVRGDAGVHRTRGLASSVGVVQVGIEFLSDGSRMVREMLEDGLSKGAEVRKGGQGK